MFSKMCISMLVASAAFLASVGAANAAGDPAAGEKVFAKCHICHQVGPNAKNAIGPELNGVVGRHSGSVEGYSYSDANKNSGIVWDVATLDTYLKNPRAKVPGTKMMFPGLQKQSDIDNVIAYLSQYDAKGEMIKK